MVYNEWIPLKEVDKDFVICEDVTNISLDTRGFHIYFGTKGEVSGCTHSIGYTISPSEIIPWLFSLQSTGLMCNDFVDVPGLGWWALKYIRFKKTFDGSFEVTDRYGSSVKWKELIQILNKKLKVN